MPTPENPARIFLSYARGDDEPFVHRLHADLTAEGFTVWFDRESLMSRGLTFHQEIKDAIRREVDRIVYVGGPKAALSAYVREEWQLGLEFDHVVVTPILRLGDYPEIPGELSLLHCEDFRDDAKYPAALAKLITSLHQPNPKLGALLGVPSLPPHFLARPELMRRVRDALLVDLQTAQVITGANARVGVQGMGGIGKSVLAAALARNREVRQSYPDGIVWISFGQDLTRDDLLSRLRDLVRHLGGDAAFTSLPQGQGVLRELLQAKSVLLVLDDVWRASDAKEFDHLGPRCRMLVTTRDAGILHSLHGELVPVSLFTEAEALQLLADAVGLAVPALPAEAREVAHECGLLPLALALSGGMAKAGHSWQDIVEALREADLEWAENREGANEQHRTIWNAMKASYDALPDEQKPRFAELAVFPPDLTVPAAAVHTLWNHTGQLTDRYCTKLLINLAERSLIQLDQKADAEGRMQRQLSLHDLLHDYATRIAASNADTSVRTAKGDESVAATHSLAPLHQALLDAYQKKCPDGWASGPDDGYFFQQMRHHLIVLERWDELCDYLTDLRSLDLRIRTGHAFEVVKDHAAAIAALPEFAEEAQRERERVETCAQYGAALVAYARECGEEKPPPLPLPPSTERSEAAKELPEERSPRAKRLRIFANFTANHASLLSAWPDEYLPLAANHAADGPLNEAEELLEADGRPWIAHSLRPPSPPLRPQCLHILLGHTDPVTSISVTSDGRRAVSASCDFFMYSSGDNALRVWDIDSGECLHTLQGHTDRVTCVSLTPDGRSAVSGSRDKTLRVWDLDSGQGLNTLEGHTNAVTCVSVAPDGRLAVSGSEDCTLRVWDLATGRCRHVLQPPASSVIPHVMDGPLALPSPYRGLSLSVCITADGRYAVSGGDNGSLYMWDLVSGQCIHTIQGELRSATCLSVTPDGRRAISGNSHHLYMDGDKAVRAWDLESARYSSALEGHTGSVTSVSLTPDGRRAVSGSWDDTVRLWDIDSGQCLHVLQGHTRVVKSVSITPDGRRAISGGGDKTLRVWDLDARQCFDTPQGHTRAITCVNVTQDGRRAISGSNDKTLRVWDLNTAQGLGTLHGHVGWVSSISVTPDGRRAVSCSNKEEEKSIRVWNLDSGQCLRILEGHSACVSEVGITRDGRRAVSCSRDCTLRVWDLNSGQCLHVLRGHTDCVSCLSLSSDGRRAVSGSWDDTGRVWDLDTGQCLHILRGHTKWVTCLSLTPDGRRAVSGSDDQTLRVWNLDSGQCIHILHGHTKWVNSANPIQTMFSTNEVTVTVTPDGRHAISGGNDKSLRVWDLESGLCLHTLQGHMNSVTSVAVTPDGLRIMSGSKDNTLRVWDLAAGRCLAVLHAPTAVGPVAVSPRGDHIVSGTGDGQMLFLSLRNFPASGPCLDSQIIPEVSDEGYERVLRRGLDHCRRDKGASHEDRLAHLAHLAALAVHINAMGRSDEAASLVRERERLADVTRQAMPAKPPPAQPKVRQASAADLALIEIRTSATQCLQKGYWEAAETHLTKLLKAGDPPQTIIPDLVASLVHAHNEVSPLSKTRVEQLLAQLGESGYGDVAQQLRQQYAAKLAPPKKPLWRFGF